MPEFRQSSLRVSVVICTVNRRASLERAVASVRRQTYRPLELIVVAAPCQDDTHAWLATQTDFTTRFVTRLNLPASCNEGIRTAGGDIVAFLDDDAYASPTWIEELVQVYEREGRSCGGVGGAVINECIRSRLVQFRHGIVNDLGEIDDVRLEPGSANAPDGQQFNRLMGANMSFRREIFLAVGGLDEALPFMHDETDLCVRVIRAGHRIVHHGRAVVHHFPTVGPMRRGDLDLNWFDIARSNVCFALRHSRHGMAPTLRHVLQRQARLLASFPRWAWQRKIVPAAAVTYSISAACGWVRGLMLGWRQASCLPLRPGQARGPFRSLAVETRRLPPQPRRPLHIALVCGSFATGWGEAARLTRTVAEALTARGHQVVVVHRADQAGPAAPGKYRLIAVPPGRIQASCLQTALLQTLQDLEVTWPIDLVESPLLFGEAAGVALSWRWPVIVRLTEPWIALCQRRHLPLDKGALDLTAAESLQLSYAAGVITPDVRMQRLVEDCFGIPLPTHARPVSQIPTGLSLAPAVAEEPRSNTGLRIQVHLSLPLVEPALLCALYTAQKQVSGSTVEFVAHEMTALENLERWQHQEFCSAVRKVWESDVPAVYCAGDLSTEQHDQLIATADVVVVDPSGGTRPVLEAFRKRKATIVLDRQSGCEGLPFGAACLPADGPDNLVAALAHLARDATLRQDLARKGRELFENQFSLYHLGSQTEAFYRQVLATWRGGAVPTQPGRIQQPGQRQAA